MPVIILIIDIVFNIFLICVCVIGAHNNFGVNGLLLFVFCRMFFFRNIFP